MRHGVLMVKGVAADANILNNVERQRFLVDLDPSDGAAYVPGDLVVNDELQRREGDRVLQVTDGAKPNRARHHRTVHRNRFLDSSLNPGHACVRFTAVDAGWTAVILGHELHPRGEQRHALRACVTEKH